VVTSKELRVWAEALRRWSESVDEIDVRDKMVQLASEMERLGERRGAAERQLV
jgi:hypothetical protein